MIYCLNVFNRENILRDNIKTIVNMLHPEFIFVASNGIEELPIEYSHVHFRKFGDNQGWQLGALNGMIQSIRFACETIINIEEHVVLFSHDDVFPSNKNVIEHLLTDIKFGYELITRYYVPGKYHMIENLIMSGKYAKKVFQDFPIISSDDFGTDFAENFFSNIVSSMRTRDKSLGFLENLENYYNIENEMGFIHKKDELCQTLKLNNSDI